MNNNNNNSSAWDHVQVTGGHTVCLSHQHLSNFHFHPKGQTLYVASLHWQPCMSTCARECACSCCECARVSFIHKTDDEQQLGDAGQSQASWQVVVFWTLVSGLCGAGHMFDPLDHFLICWRGNRTEGLIQMLAAHVGERPLLPPDRGVL